VTEGSPGSVVDLAVSGMHCASCAALIEETLVEEPGVRTVTVDLPSARARIEYESADVAVDRLCAVIAEVGYDAVPATETGTGS
jgi:copper chaperone CopZ